MFNIVKRRAFRLTVEDQPVSVDRLWRHCSLVIFVALLGASFVYSALDLCAAESDQNGLPPDGRKASPKIQSQPLTESDSLTPSGVTVEEIGPEIYYVPDKEGRLRAAVLNEITFEELKQLLGNRAAARATPPQYVLSELRATGEVTEQTIAANLYTADLPPLDLLIRTSGEVRLSNFLLWQAAYAEMIFTEILWPDFTPAHLMDALDQFSGRERRFGGR